MSSSRRPDNVSVAAVEPAPSPNTSAASMKTSELTDAEWVAQRYSNFKAFVRSLVPSVPNLDSWSVWMASLPLSVFLGGGDQELKGVREALTDKQRAAEAVLVLERWSLAYTFDLDLISDEAKDKLRRYIQLFATTC